MANAPSVSPLNVEDKATNTAPPSRLSKAAPWIIMFAFYTLSSMPGVLRIINQGGEGLEDIEEQEQIHNSSLSGEGDEGEGFGEDEGDEEPLRGGFFGDDGVRPGGLLQVHVMFSVTMNFIGPLQFNKILRQKQRALHRRLGYIYVTCGVGSGLTALLITIINPERFNTFNYVTNFVFGNWLAGSTLAALVMIRSRKIKRHQRWMIRSFGAALTVAVHRLYAILLAIPGMDQIEITAQGGAVQDFLLSAGTILVAEVIARRVPLSID